jgi:hypothetical protein
MNSKGNRHASSYHSIRSQLIGLPAVEAHSFHDVRSFIRSFESLGVRLDNKDIITIFDKLDLDNIGLVAQEDLVDRLFRDSSRSGKSAIEDSEVAIAFRKRPDLLEEVLGQCRMVEDKNK